MLLSLFLNLLFSIQSTQFPAGALMTPVLHACNARAVEFKPPIVSWLTEQDHDFQHLRQEHPKTFTFRFKNIAKEPILLQTVRTSCGCTAATWTETPIQPGETGEVEVEYDAYQRGEFRKKIRVFFDRQRKPEILWIHGEVD